jgi:hypothetical protein
VTARRSKFAVLALFAVISAALVAIPTSASAAAHFSLTLQRYGIHQGNLTISNQAYPHWPEWLWAVQREVGTTAKRNFLRTDFVWQQCGGAWPPTCANNNANNQLAQEEAKVDPIILSAYGMGAGVGDPDGSNVNLQVQLVLHEVNSTANGGGYHCPTDQNGNIGTSGMIPLPEWQNTVEQIVQYYGPGGTLAQNNPGFPGITSFELWNEPNTTTGNAATDANVQCDPSTGVSAGDIYPAETASILHYGAIGIHNGWADLGNPSSGGPWIYGPGLGSIDITYIRNVWAWDLDPVTGAHDLWSDLQTGLSVHIYPGGQAWNTKASPDYYDNGCPPAGTTYNTPDNPTDRVPFALVNLRCWMDSTENGDSSNTYIAITEAGYSAPMQPIDAGHCIPSNMVLPADADTNELGMINWIKSHESTLGVVEYFHHGAIDTNDVAPPTKPANYPTTPCPNPDGQFATYKEQSYGLAFHSPLPTPGVFTDTRKFGLKAFGQDFQTIATQ